MTESKENKKMKIDYHIHSQFSTDSRADMEEVIKAAVSKGYTEIAFSDHFDLVPTEIAIYGVPSYYQLTNELKKMRDKYPQISILTGVELGEYHRCYDTVNTIMSIAPPDVKIGAIHILRYKGEGSEGNYALKRQKANLYDGGNIANISVPLKNTVNDGLITAYYTENLELVQYGNFDILAHLGVYKRYLQEQPDESCAQEIIAEIFRTIIAKDIALEVNLSGLRKSLQSIVPDSRYLKLYKQMGGELLTIGSDTHQVDDFDLYYDETVALLQSLGLQYSARKRENGWEMIPF